MSLRFAHVVLLVCSTAASSALAPQDQRSAILEVYASEALGTAVRGATVVVRGRESKTPYTKETNNDGVAEIPLLPPDRYDICAYTIEGLWGEIPDAVRLDAMRRERVDILLKPIPMKNLSGRAFDPSRALVSNATVTLRNPRCRGGDEHKRTAVTNATGYYEFANVAFVDGLALEVEVVAQGFRTLARTVPQPANSEGQFDVTLETGMDNPALPLFAGGVRNPRAFVNYMPGVTNNGEQSVSGSGGRAVEVLVDGVSLRNSGGLSPSIESVQELKVQTNSYSAEYGRSSGAAILGALQSGTNSFHGSVFEFFQNDNLNANDFFANRNRMPRREFKQNIFGGTLGGPLVRNHLFFFTNYEGRRQRSSGIASGTVAPSEWRFGNLSALPQIIRDPQTGEPFPGNIIPSGRIVNPVARSLFADPALYPLPNNQGAGPLGVQANFLGISRRFNDNDSAGAKIDLSSPNNSVGGRFTVARYREAPESVVLPTMIGSDRSAPTMATRIDWTRTIKPTVINDARFEVSRARFTVVPIDPAGLLGPLGNARVGIPGGQGASGMSELQIGEGLSAIGGLGIVSDSRTNTFLFRNNFLWIRSSHTIKIGGQLNYYRQNRLHSGNNGTLGFFSYDGRFTGSAFADFLLDHLAHKGQGSATKWEDRHWYTALYLQDDFKVASNVTLNLGLRWEFTQPIYEAQDRQINIDIFTGEVRRAGDDRYTRALFAPYYRQFQPRVGFAWSPVWLGAGRFVIKGGYGCFGDAQFDAIGPDLRLPLNPPYFFESDVQYATSNPGTIASGFLDTPVADLLSGRVRAWSANLRPGFIQQYNIGTDLHIPGSFVVTAGYFGYKGTHLLSPREGNQAPPGDGPIDPRRPLANVHPTLTSISHLESSSIASYNSFHLAAERKYANGFGLYAIYTLGKTLTDSPAWRWTGTLEEGSWWQNAYDRRAEYGPAGFDVRHNLRVSGIMGMPFGRGRRWGSAWNGPIQAVAGGWDFSAFWEAHSGFPITITSPGLSNSGNRVNRAMRFRDLIIENRSIDHWFGTHPSARPCPANVDNGICAYGQQWTNQFGTAGVGTERGPRFNTIDFVVKKEFPILEKMRLELGAEFYNALNLVNFDAPVTDSASGQWGAIRSQANQPRNVQFRLKLIF